MKTILILVAIVVVALVTFNFLTTGEVSVLPNVEPTGEAAELKTLADQLHAAFEAYHRTGRDGDLSGVDTKADLRYIAEEIDSIELKLKVMKKSAKSIEVRGEAEKLLEEIIEHRMDVS